MKRSNNRKRRRTPVICRDGEKPTKKKVEERPGKEIYRRIAHSWGYDKISDWAMNEYKITPKVVEDFLDISFNLGTSLLPSYPIPPEEYEYPLVVEDINNENNDDVDNNPPVVEEPVLPPIPEFPPVNRTFEEYWKSGFELVPHVAHNERSVFVFFEGGNELKIKLKEDPKKVVKQDLWRVKLIYKLFKKSNIELMNSLPVDQRLNIEFLPHEVTNEKEQVLYLPWNVKPEPTLNTVGPIKIFCFQKVLENGIGENNGFF